MARNEITRRVGDVATRTSMRNASLRIGQELPSHAKVTADIVRCIRQRYAQRYADCGMTFATKRLAEEYPMLRRGSIYDIIKRNTWRNA